MTYNENNGSTNPQLEERLLGYFSLYTAEPEYKSTLQEQLLVKSSQQSIIQAKRRENNFIEYLHNRPAYKWIAALVLIILIFIMLFAIRPVRAAIERLIDFGYLEGAGFVQVSETYVLGGPIYSIKQDEMIGIDRVIADPIKTQVWLHVKGVQFTPENMKGEFLAFLEINGQKLLLQSHGWDAIKQAGIFEFNSLGNGISNPFTLHISPDWSIPIKLIPMSSIDQSQTTTIYPDICQTHLDVEMCLRTFVSDTTGYHLWLSASSKNPLFYMQTLDTWNHLTGGEANLVDSQGHLLTRVFTSQLPVVMEISPVITDATDEVRTSLSFERSTDKSGPLELVVGGFTGKAPANETIECDLGQNPQVGDRFACEKEANIAGQLVRFHEGEITQHSDGIHLTLLSDPVQATDGMLLTFVDFDSLSYENSPFGGVEYTYSTRQLEIWQGLDVLKTESKFSIRITAAYFTILEPFRLTWVINP
jgi:hypothetical protein